MTRSWLSALAPLGVLALAACSSSSTGSGVDRGKKLSQLSADERDQLCAFRVDVEQAPRTVTCGSMPSVTLEGKASCLAGLDGVTLQCQATVGDAEACYLAIADDPCTFGVGTCTALFTCVLPSD